MPKKEKEEKEEMVSMYDPSIDAFREITVSQAKKFIAVAKELDKKLTKEKE